MKIARLLIYEGTADRLQKQLGESLADGKKKFGKIELSTITIGITEGLNRFVEAQFDLVEKKKYQRPDLKVIASDTAVMQQVIADLRNKDYKVSWAYRNVPDITGEVFETFCSIFKNSSYDFTGQAKKHPKDTPNLKVARAVSFNRAYTQYLERFRHEEEKEIPESQFR